MRRARVVAATFAVIIVIAGSLIMHRRRAGSLAPAAARSSTQAVHGVRSAGPVATSDVLVKPNSEDDYLRELTRLNAVDKALALTYAKKGDEWYSSTGKAAEARKAMAITVLVDIGNMDEARRLTYAFIDAYPGSSYLPLVQGVTGIHPRPGRP